MVDTHGEVQKKTFAMGLHILDDCVLSCFVAQQLTFSPRSAMSLTTEHTTEILEIWPCLLLLGGVQIIDSSFTRNSSLVVCGSHGPIP